MSGGKERVVDRGEWWKSKKNGEKERETKRGRREIVVSGDIRHFENTLWTLVWSGVQTHGWEPACPAIFVLLFLPSDVMLLVSQELGQDKREAGENASALPLYHAKSFIWNVLPTVKESHCFFTYSIFIDVLLLSIIPQKVQQWTDITFMYSMPNIAYSSSTQSSIVV